MSSQNLFRRAISVLNSIFFSTYCAVCRTIAFFAICFFSPLLLLLLLLLLYNCLCRRFSASMFFHTHFSTPNANRKAFANSIRQSIQSTAKAIFKFLYLCGLGWFAFCVYQSLVHGLLEPHIVGGKAKKKPEKIRHQEHQNRKESERQRKGKGNACRVQIEFGIYDAHFASARMRALK